MAKHLPTSLTTAAFNSDRRQLRTSDIITYVIPRTLTHLVTKVFQLPAPAFRTICQLRSEPQTLLLTDLNVNLRPFCPFWSDEASASSDYDFRHPRNCLMYQRS